MKPCRPCMNFSIKSFSESIKGTWSIKGNGDF